MLKQISLAFALSLSFAFVFSIASCSSGGGGSGGGDDTPSSSSYTSAEEKENADYPITINKFSWRNEKSGRVDVNVSVAIQSSNAEDLTFDKVLVQINGTTINEDTKIGNNGSEAPSGQFPGRVTFGYNTSILSEGSFQIPGEICGNTFTLQVFVYAGGDNSPKSISQPVSLQAEACPSSGSGEPPSSSSKEAESHTLTRISFEGSETVLIGAQRGVVLSTGAITTDVSNADVYYVRTGDELRSDKGNTFASLFVKNGSCSELFGDGITKNTNQFVPCLSSFESSVEGMTEGYYYIVRTDNSTESWGSKWFLIHALEKPANDKSSLYIEAWKY